jgi:hypothetical protein
MKNLYSFFIVICLTGCGQQESGNKEVDQTVGPQSETIVNEEAADLYTLAQEEGDKGGAGWDKALEYYNLANELEPENPIILHARGQFKIMSEFDIEGGFQDHADAIRFSKDSFMVKMRYSNRALDFLGVGDICSACEDWKRAGDAESYWDKYCKRDFDNSLNSNPDDQLELELTISDSVVYISSAQKSAAVSNCQGTLAIVNNSHPAIIIREGLLDLGHEVGSSNSLFLEATDADGNKFHFLKDGHYSTTSHNADDTLETGFVYVKELNVLADHHFAYPGNYNIRLGLRHSGRLNELKQTYYSNWCEIEVVRK